MLSNLGVIGSMGLIYEFLVETEKRAWGTEKGQWELHTEKEFTHYRRGREDYTQ